VSQRDRSLMSGLGHSRRFDDFRDRSARAPTAADLMHRSPQARLANSGTGRLAVVAVSFLAVRKGQVCHVCTRSPDH